MDRDKFGNINNIDNLGTHYQIGVPAEVDPVVDGKVSRQMIPLWTQFAATGDPSVKGMASWPTYYRTSEQYVDIGETLQVKSGYSKITLIPYVK